jgi:hypothetical protein
MAGFFFLIFFIDFLKHLKIGKPQFSITRHHGRKKLTDWKDNRNYKDNGNYDVEGPVEVAFDRSRAASKSISHNTCPSVG